MQDLRNISPDVYTDQRYREGEFICDICGEPWPVSHRRRMRSGLYVGTQCCFEPRGDEVQRDINRAAAGKLASRLSKKEQLEGLRGPDGVAYPGSNPLAGSESIDYGGTVVTITPNPIVLVRGGSAVAVTLAGIGFDAGDTITYGNAGITNASISLVSSVLWSLSVQASIGMPVGRYTFKYNDTLWQAVFDVR